MPTESSRTVAILGPLGTYTHQACLQMFGDAVKLAPEPTIVATFNALSNTVPLALLPAENSTHGSVVDTYNLLRLQDVGSRVRIAGETTLRIEHCLIGPKGMRIEDVREVVSHEQALGQCTTFLNDHLPNATQKSCSSTAEAARQVLLDEPGAGRAAISCAVVVSLYPGSCIIRRGIQDQGENYTRFFLLSSCSLHFTGSQSPKRVVFRLQPQLQGDGIVPLLLALALPTTKIDRRPSLLPKPFHDVYLIEADVRDEEDVGPALARVRAAGGEIVLLGSWEWPVACP